MKLVTGFSVRAWKDRTFAKLHCADLKRQIPKADGLGFQVKEYDVEESALSVLKTLKPFDVVEVDLTERQFGKAVSLAVADIIPAGKFSDYTQTASGWEKRKA